MLNLYRSLSLKQKALVWGAGIAFVVLLFSFGSEIVVAAAQIAAAVGTLALAALAYAQINEMREARLDQERPQVIVDADYSRRGLVDLVIRNIGKGAAKSIQFEFSTPLVSRFPETESKVLGLSRIDEVPAFKDGLDYLAPGAEIRILWDGAIGFWEFLEQQELHDGITITTHCKSMSGNPVSTRWVVNPLRLSRLVDAGKGISELVQVAEKFQKDFHKATRNSAGAIKVLTQTKEERDKNVAEQAKKSEEWISRLRGDQGEES